MKQGIEAAGWEKVDKELSKEAMKILHYFAVDTCTRIIRHIDRMGIKDTGALKNSIASTVYTNAGGNMTLVRFFYLHYAECVEQAVGRYYGIDADLPKDKGLSSENVGAPQIQGLGYGAMKGIIKGVPNPRKTEGGRTIDRGDWHKPRPFLSSEIKNSVERVSVRLMREVGNILDIRTMRLMGAVAGDMSLAALAPYLDKGTVVSEYSESAGFELKI